MACVVTPAGQAGISIYKSDFKQRISTGGFSSTSTKRLRRNRPHPNQDFLLPSHINDGIKLQKKVRRAVREYLDEIYSQEGSRPPSRPPPQFVPPRNDEDLKPKEVLYPKASEKFYRAYPFYNETYRQQLKATGKPVVERERPSTAVVTERSPPSHLKGESKRDRSIRIRQEIEGKNRVPTPSPQPKKWQRIASAVPAHKKITYSKPAQEKRVSSAPPAVQGYSYYKQSTRDTPTTDMYAPMQDKLKTWADNANDYEKQVVYNLLSRAAQQKEGPPATPPSPQEAYHMLLRAKSVPVQRPFPPPHEETNEKRSSWSPYFKDLRRQQNKQRNLSAPHKPMLGLIPNATQYPQRDQRAYRLKGQDSRVMGKPQEERELKEYLSKVGRVTQKQWRQQEKKFLIAPMHSYPDRNGSKPKDYKCDVSFFQSVRAPFKSHFIIHPDFTSETYIQKKRADQMVSHIQY